MANQWNVGDHSSQAWRVSIDDIDEWGLLDHQPDETETEPMAEEAGVEDPLQAEDNVEEAESDEL